MDILKRGFAALLLFAGCTMPGLAATIFAFSDFSSCAGLQVNGNAACTANVLRLTPSLAGQSGSAFSTTQVQLGGGASFSTFFSFRMSAVGGIGDSDGTGADGIVFVVQPVSSTVGGGGGGIGYSGIPTSLGVEFDTFFNGGDDPDGNHVGIDLNGSIASVSTASVATRLNDGNVWFAWVDYDGSALEVRLSQTAVRPLTPLISFPVNLATVLGTTQAFVGFTAGTGAGFENHDILTWQFSDVFAPIGIAAAPSAPTLSNLALGVLILLAGLGGAILARRRAGVR